MRLYYWMDPEHESEFDEVPKSICSLGIVPNVNTTAEGIRDYYHFLSVVEDKTNTIEFDADKLSNTIIEMFKASKCYQEKTEQDRQAIINYIKKDPGALPKLPNGFDIDV